MNATGQVHLIEDDLATEPEDWLADELHELDVLLTRHTEFAAYIEEHEGSTQ